MSSANKMIGYRPDPTERAILEAYKAKTGLPFARVLALALREKADRENMRAAPTVPPPPPLQTVPWAQILAQIPPAGNETAIRFESEIEGFPTDDECDRYNTLRRAGLSVEAARQQVFPHRYSR